MNSCVGSVSQYRPLAHNKNGRREVGRMAVGFVSVVTLKTIFTAMVHHTKVEHYF